MNWHTQHKQNLSLIARAEETISNFCGTRTFLLLHILWFGYWILRPVEPFPYGLLTMIVSLEAILLSSIIMINQRRHDAILAAAAEHDKRVEEDHLLKLLKNTATIELNMRAFIEAFNIAVDTGAAFEILRENTTNESLRAVAMAAALFAKNMLKEVKANGKRTHKRAAK